MLKLQVVDSFVETRSGVKDGKPWTMVQQTNCFLQINGEVRRFPQLLNEGKQPLPAGMYEFNGESLLTMGRYGLEVDRFKELNLIPVTNSVSKVA